MIQNVRHKRPNADFGLGVTTITVPIGTIQNVWQNEIYNKDLYFADTTLTDLDFEVVNLNNILVYCDTVGEYEFRVLISRIDKSINLQSNRIKIIVE